MSKEIIDSVGIILEHPKIALLIAILSSSHLLLLTGSPIVITNMSYTFAIFSIITIPIIYGIFVEILKEKKYTITKIAKEHIVNYIIISLIIGIPSLVYSILTVTILHNLSAFTSISFKISISFITTLLSIYILPLVFITGSILQSLVAGILLITKETKSNYDLIILSTLAFTLAMFARYTYFILDDARLLASLLAFTLTFFAFYGEIVVFIAASMRLKLKAKTV